MQEFVDGLVANGFAPSSIPVWVHYLTAMLVFGGIVVFGFVLPIAGITTWVERRVAGRIQSRIGPNRTGPAGFLQWLADGIKSLLKEDIVPDAADAPLFKLAPYVVMTGFVGAFVALPFGGPLIIADLNVGILYITAVTSLVVVGILMAGWSSNNKWSLLGGIRSAAQIVSYEIPAGLSIFPIVMLSGALSMQSIIAEQGAAPWRWFIFNNPFTFIAFFIFFVAVWLRWTLPRIRVDQMMIMCWKYLVPLAFVNLLGTAAWMVVFPHGAPGVPQLLCVAAAVLLGLFLRRVRYHLTRAGLKREELSYNILATERIPGLG